MRFPGSRTPPVRGSSSSARPRCRPRFPVRTIIPRTKDEDDYEKTVQPCVLPWWAGGSDDGLSMAGARGTEPPGHLENESSNGRAKHRWAGRSLARLLPRSCVHMVLPLSSSSSSSSSSIFSTGQPQEPAVRSPRATLREQIGQCESEARVGRAVPRTAS